MYGWISTVTVNSSTCSTCDVHMSICISMTNVHVNVYSGCK